MKFALVTLVGVLCVLALPVVAQKPPVKTPPKPGTTPVKPTVPPELTPFIGRLAAARARAKERNVPILVHVLLDAEEASDRYRTSVLTDTGLVQKSAECLIIIANPGVHPKAKIEVTVDGAKKTREVCSVFTMFISCSDHKATWDDLYSELREADGTLHCPQTVVFGPDGKIAARINTAQAPTPEEILAEIAGCQVTFGMGLTEAQLDTVKKALEVGAAHLSAKAWVDAWRSYTTVLLITKNSPYAEEALKNQPHALAGMKAEFTRMCGLLVPGSAVKGYRELTDFARATIGTPLEAEVAARLKKVESDKALQPEISAWKIGVEADQILSEARDLYADKQDKKAEKLVRKLFGKRYATTSAVETAKKLWPEIAAEEAAKSPPK